PEPLLGASPLPHDFQNAFFTRAPVSHMSKLPSQLIMSNHHAPHQFPTKAHPLLTTCANLQATVCDHFGMGCSRPRIKLAEAQTRRNLPKRALIEEVNMPWRL